MEQARHEFSDPLTNPSPFGGWLVQSFGHETAGDEINQKLGRDTVKVGYYARTGAWQTRFRKRSPRYTPHYNQFMNVR